MRLLLIRHGQTTSNVEGALDTARPGASLTALGRAQAAAIPSVIGTEPITAVYASPLVRTQQTAAPLAAHHGFDAEVREGLEEISAGDYEMRTDEAAVHGYMQAAWRWTHGELDFRVEGGESGEEFFARFDRAITQIAAANDAAAVVSHGAAIRVWTANRATNVNAVETVQRRLHNTGMTVLEGSPEAGWALVEWHEDPLGGALLEGSTAHDVTGDPEAEPAQ